MSTFNVNDILGKLNELRAVFVLGQRALPFIEEIFFFLKEVSPLLEEINSSMMDSALKMPHATSQLQHISLATKTATDEILDLIDVMLVKSQTFDGHLDQSLSDVAHIRSLDERSLEILRSCLDEPTLAAVKEIIEERDLRLHSIEGSVHARRTLIDEIRSETNRITTSLQVQDITAQQIASVTHLLDSMRERMAQLLERLDAQKSSVRHSPVLEVPQDAAFDPNAEYDPSSERQRAVDQIVTAMHHGDADNHDLDEIFQHAALAMQLRRARESDRE